MNATATNNNQVPQKPQFSPPVAQQPILAVNQMPRQNSKQTTKRITIGAGQMAQRPSQGVKQAETQGGDMTK